MESWGAQWEEAEQDWQASVITQVGCIQLVKMQVELSARLSLLCLLWSWVNFLQLLREIKKKKKKPKWERGRRRPAPLHLCKEEMWGAVDSLLSKLKSTNWPNSRMCSLCLLETRILRNQRVYQWPPEIDKVTLASRKLPLKSDAFKNMYHFVLLFKNICIVESLGNREKIKHTHLTQQYPC